MFKAHIEINTTLDCTGFIEQGLIPKEISDIIENELFLEEIRNLITGALAVSVRYYTEEEEED